MTDFKTYFEETFKLKINNLDYYNQALTHNSYANEHHLKYTYQRLEFLGDALIEKSISLFLFKTNKHENEGFLTKKRSEMVREETLSQVSREIGLNKYLRLGNGEESSGGRNKDSILADIFESITAAVYLDNETENPEQVLKTWLDQTLIAYIKLDDYQEMVRDYKSELQELLQAEKRTDLVYKVVHETRKPDNNMEYEIAIELDNQTFGQGKGSSKQEAEQNAAKEALSKLKK